MFKRYFVASALAVAGAAVCAQTSGNSLQMYGLVDAGVTHVTGLKGGSDNRLASGIMDGSRWGLRGNEDISPGWRAIFTLESRLEVNDGSLSNRAASGRQAPDRLSDAALLGLPAAFQVPVSGVAQQLGSTIGINLPSRFWDRQAYVGLVTPVGAVLAGRQYTPAYELSSIFDIMGTQSSLAAGQVAATPTAIDIRASNALAYRLVAGPITAVAMVTTSEDLANVPHLRAGYVLYKGDGLSVGAGYNTRRNEVGDKSLTSALVGASYETGAHKVSTMLVTAKDDHPSGVSTIAATLIANNVPAGAAALIQNAFQEGLRQDARLGHIGYRYMTGPNTIYLAYSRLHDRLRDADTASYGVAYSYALSKRTDFSLVLTHFNNSGLAQAAPGGAGYLGGVTATAGKDSNSYALGLRHRF